MSDRLRELLLKAVRSLDQSEQDEVLGHLLIGGTSSMILGSPHGMPPGARPSPAERLMLAEQITTTLGVASGDLKLLPVRLPADDYERLRTWSRENGFSMAVIIRTLVERFLAGQAGRRPTTPAAPAAAEETG